MSPVELSASLRESRELLSRALGAIQSDPALPPATLGLVPVLGRAMGAIGALERAPGGDLAAALAPVVSSARDALDRLASSGGTRPSAGAARAALSGAVEKLTNLRDALASAAPASASVAGGTVRQEPLAEAFAAVQAAQATASPPVTASAPARTEPMPAGTVQQAPLAEAFAAAGLGPPVAGTVPMADLATVDCPIAPGGPNGFWCGIGGNDVVEHGGVFVATAAPPAVGTPLRLRISLPSGHEFEARLVVRWRRDATAARAGQPAGFGAQFLELSADSRDEVWRYCRAHPPARHTGLDG